MKPILMYVFSFFLNNSYQGCGSGCDNRGHGGRDVVRGDETQR